jgi:hypothetical protein
VLAGKVPAIGRLLKYQTYWMPGHYYSPIPKSEQAIYVSAKQFGKALPIAGIDMNDSNQLELLQVLIPFMKQSTFRNEVKVEGHRFYNKNGIYGYSDALFLESMIRHLRPSKIIEAGSGFTSALMMDINERYFNNAIDLEFIEPYPERLFSLLTKADQQRISLKILGLQSIDLSLFASLNENDILFIDSSHVAKTGSDLLYLFFEVLPILKKGVFVHFHDIFNNFEYPQNHFEKFKGFGWNENYFLRSFLMYNEQFEIVLFSNYLDTKFRDVLVSLMPDYPLLTGAQLWIKKQ